MQRLQGWIIWPSRCGGWRIKALPISCLTLDVLCSTFGFPTEVGSQATKGIQEPVPPFPRKKGSSDIRMFRIKFAAERAPFQPNPVVLQDPCDISKVQLRNFPLFGRESLLQLLLQECLHNMMMRQAAVSHDTSGTAAQMPRSGLAIKMRSLVSQTVGTLQGRGPCYEVNSNVIEGSVSQVDGRLWESTGTTRVWGWRALQILFLKMSLRMDEALQWKGGIIHHAWTGKQSLEEYASHHALLISSVVGKSLHGTIRHCCIEPMRRASTPLQVGRLPAYPVTYTSHCVRLFQSMCKGSTYFLLFPDLREAFYRVYRALLHSDSPSEEELAHMFCRLELPPSAFERQTVNSEDALLAADAGPWLRMVLREMLSNTWFKLHGQEDAVQTSLGVKPGDALADSMFFFIFVRKC